LPLIATGSAALERLPALALGVTIAAYWLCVGLMVLRVRRRARGASRVLIPAQRIEQVMWLVWAPLLAAWLALPWIFAYSSSSRHSAVFGPWLDLGSATVLFVRLAAAVVALWCLARSIRCWLHMGKDWRMGVDPTQQSRLIDDGPFAHVRHPIYALSILLILCSAIAVPTAAMAILAGVHILLMNLKAQNEERFLLERHGAEYAAYCRRVPRFVPLRSLRGKLREDGAALRRDEPVHPLNSFQRAMLLWEETHPYIAAHAVELEGSLDSAALRQAIAEVYTEARLGELSIDRERLTCSYSASVEAAVRALPPSADSPAALAELLTAELNVAFPGGPHSPIRWFAFDCAGATVHTLALVYHHIAADAQSVARLLADVLRRYTGGAQKSGCSVAAAATGTTEAPGATRWPVLGFVRAMVLYFRFRFVHKMPDEREMGDETAVLLHSMPAGFVTRLAAACRSRGAGLNDAFLAALAMGIAELTPDRHTSRHRRRLALATVMSGRERTEPETISWGVRLSDAILMIRKPDAAPPDLLGEIAGLTRPLKQQRGLNRSVSAMQGFFIRHIWPIFEIPNHRRSYRKLLPICGGVSTFSGDPSLGELSGRIRRYTRACPCGPATPVVLAPTLLGDRLDLGLTWRLSCFPREKAAILLRSVVAALELFAGLSSDDRREADRRE
jgi:protein-S-isoprenylcysteine O-methyltransferase Ste14